MEPGPPFLHKNNGALLFDGSDSGSQINHDFDPLWVKAALKNLSTPGDGVSGRLSELILVNVSCPPQEDNDGTSA